MEDNILTQKNRKCKGSLCFYCKRCTDCSWMRDLIPVPGWTATATEIVTHYSSVTFPSYHVYDCPNFVLGKIKEDDQCLQ